MLYRTHNSLGLLTCDGAKKKKIKGFQPFFSSATTPSPKKSANVRYCCTVSMSIAVCVYACVCMRVCVRVP